MQAADDILERAITHVLNAHKPVLRKKQIASSYLTHREHDCLGLILRGHSAQRIAALMGVDVRQANVHIQNILSKLNYKNRSELIAQEFQKIVKQSA